MTVAAGVLVDQVLQRVRDEHATGTSRPLVRDLLTHCQRLINAKLGLVIESIEYETVAKQCVYPLASVVPRALRIVGVQQGNRDLVEVKWQEFWYLHRAWLRDTGQRLENFALVGRDMLILYPAQPEPRTVTLRCAVTTAPLTSDDTPVEAPIEFHPLLVDLATVVGLVRQRTYLTLPELTESIKSRLA